MQTFNVGDKVTFKTKWKTEKGIVKSLSDDDHVFVVYNCNDDWENYADYTGARTRIIDLVLGW
jgi:hypothetical protein